MRPKEVRVPVWARRSNPKINTLRKLKLRVLLLSALAIAITALCKRELFQWILPPSYPMNLLTKLSPEVSPDSQLLIQLLVIGMVVIFALWILPVLQVTYSKALTPDKQFDRENEARKTLAQIVAGVFVLAGLYSSVQTLDLSREGQMTDRFTKAVEQLGAADSLGKPKLEVRIGGVYALEWIARDSRKDDWPIMEVLSAYIRQHNGIHRSPKIEKPQMVEDSISITPDIQSALTVLGRRNIKYDRESLDLNETNLKHAKLWHADLSGAMINDSNLSEGDLMEAKLVDAAFNTSNLSHANLEGADLRRAFLFQSNLSHANFYSANLENANLQMVDLRMATVNQADLEGSNIGGADISGAEFYGSNLRCEGLNTRTGQYCQGR